MSLTMMDKTLIKLRYRPENRRGSFLLTNEELDKILKARGIDWRKEICKELEEEIKTLRGCFGQNNSKR